VADRSFTVSAPIHTTGQLAEVGYALLLDSIPAGPTLRLDTVLVTTPQLIWVDRGSSHSVSAMSPIDVGEIRYLFESWVEGGNQTKQFAASGPLNLTAKNNLQYRVVVSADPATPTLIVDGARVGSGTAYWWDEGGTHWVEADAIYPLRRAERLAWSNWSDGSGRGHLVIATAPLTLIARFASDYLLTLSSAHGGPSCGEAECWFRAGAMANISVDEIVGGPPGTRFVFAGWTGDANGSTPFFAVRMDGPKTVDATWTTQYLVTVSSAYGAARGGGWYANGSVVVADVSPKEITIGGRSYTFQGWKGQPPRSDPSAGFNLTGSVSLVAVWGEKPGLDWLAPSLIVIAFAAIGAGFGLFWTRRRRNEMQLERMWKDPSKRKPER